MKHPTTRPARRRRTARRASPTSWATTRPRRSRSTGSTRRPSRCTTGCSRPPTRGPCPRTCSWSRPGRRTAPTSNDPMSCARTRSSRARVCRHAGKIWTPPTGRRDPTSGRRSRGSSTTTASRGATTSAGHLRRAAVREARRDRDRARAEPAARVHGDRRHRPARQHPLQRRSSSRDAKAGNLPSVSWVMPVADRGEHPPDSIEMGQAYVAKTDQLGDAGPRGAVAAHRDLPDVGRLGRLLRPREAARGSTRTAGASACPSIVISPWAKPRIRSTIRRCLRRVPEADRGPIPGGRALDPRDRAGGRCAPHGREETRDPRRPRERLRLPQEPIPPLVLNPALPLARSAASEAVAPRDPLRVA